MDIGKRLTKLLSKSKLLYNESANGAGGELTYTLLECVDNKYVFNIAQINSFVKQALVGRGTFFSNLDDNKKKIIKYIFSNHVIPEKTFDALATNWYLTHYAHNYWLECMLDVKYNFSVNELCLITNTRLTKWGDYDVMHNNVVYGMCMSIIHKNRDNAEKYLTIIIKNKKPFNPEHLEIVLKIVNKYYHNIGANNIWLNQLLENLLKNHEGCDVFGPLMKHYDDRIAVMSIYEYVINHFGYNDELVNFIFENKIKQNPEIIFNLIDKGYKLTMDNVNKLLGYMSKFAIDPKKYECAKPFIDVAFTHISFNVYDLYKMFDLIPTLNELNIACKIGCSKTGIYLMDTYNIIPEKETLDICMSTNNYELIEKVLHYKLTPDDITLNHMKGGLWGDVIPKIVDLLLAHGLTINDSHMDFLLSNKITVNDLERFGIKYDDKLYFGCFVYSFWPDSYISKIVIDKNIQKLYDLCKSKKLDYNKLIDFMKTNNVGLNKYALDYLMNYNAPIAKIMMDKHECVPSLLSMSKKCNLPHKMLRDIINNNGIDEVDMLKCYDICL